MSNLVAIQMSRVWKGFSRCRTIYLVYVKDVVHTFQNTLMVLDIVKMLIYVNQEYYSYAIF